MSAVVHAVDANLPCAATKNVQAVECRKQGGNVRAGAVGNNGLKVRVIPVLTFNGLGLVKTRCFASPRMVGNPVQAARVYNSRGVDELVFLDISASKQHRKINLKIVGDVVRQCFMPVAIGGGISTLEDINDLLRIGADKVVIASAAINNPRFIRDASSFFGAQCITVAADVWPDDQGVYRLHHDQGGGRTMQDFLGEMQAMGAGEIMLTAVHKDGTMLGFDVDMTLLAEACCRLPMVVVGGGGEPHHFRALFEQTRCEAVGASSMYHFTQFTPHDIKGELRAAGKMVRFSKTRE
jgi:cyclase